MAVYGVVADVHGNLEALQAVLALFARRGVDQLLCLGDIVGFNADPDECAALIRERRALAVAGNHDLISLGQLGFDRCANKVIYSLKRTRRRLAPATVDYLGSLPTRLVVEDRFLLVHGGVRDVEQYVVAARHVRENASYLRSDFPGLRICLFGHTHEQKVYELEGEDVRELPPPGPLTLREDRRYLINPGSVDPSRKREHKLAECALFDSAASTIEFHRLAYDHALTEAKAVAGGYRIDVLTDRLYSLRRLLLGRREIEG